VSILDFGGVARAVGRAPLPKRQARVGGRVNCSPSNQRAIRRGPPNKARAFRAKTGGRWRGRHGRVSPSRGSLPAAARPCRLFAVACDRGQPPDGTSACREPSRRHSQGRVRCESRATCLGADWHIGHLSISFAVDSAWRQRYRAANHAVWWPSPAAPGADRYPPVARVPASHEGRWLPAANGFSSARPVARWP